MAAGSTGLVNVKLTLTGPDGVLRSATSNAFGNFRFDDVEVGQTYVLTVHSRRYEFPEPVRVLNVFEEVTDADFIALPF